MVNCAWWFNPRLAAPREAAAAGLCKTPRRVEEDGLDAPASEVFGSARRRGRREEALDFSDHGALALQSPQSDESDEWALISVESEEDKDAKRLKRQASWDSSLTSHSDDDADGEEGDDASSGRASSDPSSSLDDTSYDGRVVRGSGEAYRAAGDGDGGDGDVDDRPDSPRSVSEDDSSLNSTAYGGRIVRADAQRSPPRVENLADAARGVPDLAASDDEVREDRAPVREARPRVSSDESLDCSRYGGRALLAASRSACDLRGVGGDDDDDDLRDGRTPPPPSWPGDDGGLDGTRRGGRVPPFGRPRAASFTCLAVLDDAAGIGAALGRPRSAGFDAEAAMAEASLDDSFYGSRAVSAERRSSSYHRRFPVSASLPSIAHEEGLGATRRPRCVRFATPLVARVEFFEPARASEKASTWFSRAEYKSIRDAAWFIEGLEQDEGEQDFATTAGTVESRRGIRDEESNEARRARIRAVRWAVVAASEQFLPPDVVAKLATSDEAAALARSAGEEDRAAAEEDAGAPSSESPKSPEAATVTRAAVQKILKDHRGASGLAPLVRRDSLENLLEDTSTRRRREAGDAEREREAGRMTAARSRAALKLYFDARQARSLE